MRNPKIGHFSYSDSAGGAAIAANRIHQALREFGVDSRLYVNHENLNDFYTSAPESFKSKIVSRFKSLLWDNCNHLLATDATEVLSLNLIDSSWPKVIGKSDLDAVNLHWINREFMSVSDVSRMDIPVFWTLHDLWPLQGIYHYEERDSRNFENLSKKAILDFFDSSLLRMKKKHFKNVAGIIAPSQWIATIAEKSEVFPNAKIKVIPNPLNEQKWKFIETQVAKDILDLNHNYSVGYTSLGGSGSFRKGFDLLQASLVLLEKSGHNFQLISWGAKEKPKESTFDTGVKNFGIVRDEISLRTLYAACDVLVVPSREDNLPQVAVEAILSGTPVVCFNVGGLSDIVTHKVNGYLAEPFDVADLANGIKWVLESLKEIDKSIAIRENAIIKYSSKQVARQYLDFYNDVI